MKWIDRIIHGMSFMYPCPPIETVASTTFRIEPLAGPGFNRRPAPGDPLFVLHETDIGEEVIIRHGTCYSYTVGAYADEEEPVVTEVTWHEGDDTNDMETSLQQDTFFWFDDALCEARKRCEKQLEEEKAEEPVEK
jgi:hypothetical protein